MNPEQRSKVYDRLLAINIEVETDKIPYPQYINGKIGECHTGIEEVERYYIQTSKEISVIQRVLNDAKARFEYEKEDLIANSQAIKDLPSIRDREARANNLLKERLSEINGYENEQFDLDNLLKVISLKMKNLNRINTDIKMQLRVMEAQIKLGAFHPDKVATTDIFEGATTRMRHTQVVDPTAPIDVDNLLNPVTVDTIPVPVTPTGTQTDAAVPAPDNLSTTSMTIPQSLIEPNDDAEQEDAEEALNQDDTLEEEEESITPETTSAELSPEILTEAEQSKPEYTLDLDKILDNITTPVSERTFVAIETPAPMIIPEPVLPVIEQKPVIDSKPITPEGGPTTSKVDVIQSLPAKELRSTKDPPIPGEDKIDLDSLLSQFK